MEFIDTKCQNPTGCSGFQEYMCQNCGRQICAMCVQSFDNDDLTDDSVVLICDGCVYDRRQDDEFGEDEIYNDYGEEDGLMSMPDGTRSLPDGSNLDYVSVKLGILEGEE